jgi:hypothetical protein
VARGVRLACEACDYAAELYECATLGGEATRDALSSTPPDLSAADAVCSFLCPQCLEPVHLSRPLAPEPRCPRCGVPLLDFATASRELAAASRSRATLDLRAERTAMELVETLLAQASALEVEVATRARSTTVDALAALRQALALQVAQAAHATSPWAPLDETTALASLSDALARAPNLAASAKLLRDRALQAQRHVTSLEACIDDEADLPGVPCPRCGIGHLLHWPIWQ